MIDLIIPYYNNPEGLKRTLDSINTDIFYVTVIDDNSTIYPPYNPKANQIFRYNINRGPGFARQWGINKTSNPYIMFIDTGDIFISKEVQEEITQVVNEHSIVDIISFPYYHKGKLTNEADNRMHGKIYRRTFLDKYNITFCAQSSYMNEDIGFNRTCRLLQDNMLYMETPIIQQIDEPNSLTNKDNNVALYRDQTRALSLVSIHTIETCRKNNIHADIERDQIAIHLYYWFIRCAAERPEFIQEAWNGAKIFYNYFNNEIDSRNLWMGSAAIKKCLQYKNQIHFPINILRFVHDMQLYENIPNNYLT